MVKILVCDDEEKIRALIEKYIQFEGFTYEEATNGLEAVELCKKTNFDILIMDIMMPEMDGFGAVKEIRKNSNVPVIMLSAKGEEYDKLYGFEIGVDDYVVKPFSPKELMMRVEAILKRGKAAKEQEHDLFTKDDLVIDFTARKVTIQGKPINLSPKEYDLLFYLCKNRNVAISREKLLSEVWGYDFFGDDRTLDTHIKLLRKDLGAYSDLIVTLRGTGYRFDDKEQK